MGVAAKTLALLVEDEAGIAELLKTRLESEGMDVLAAVSAEAAEEVLKSACPDLILLDYSLPGKDGGEFLGWLKEKAREHGCAAPPPVVITTGRGDERLAVELMKLGAVDYLVKDGDFLKRIVPVAKRALQEGRLKKELLEQQNRFRDIFELSNVAKSITQADGTVVPNAALCELLGYTREELSRKNWRDITPAEDVPATEAILDRLISGKEEKARFEKRYLRKDGGLVWGDVSVKIKRTRDGKTDYFITSIVDITARKLAQQELAESESRLRALGDNLPDGMTYQIDTGESGELRVFLYVGAGVERLHGIRREDAMRDPGLIYGQMDREDAARLAAVEREAIAARKPFSAEARVRMPDGRVRWSLFSSAPRSGKDGHVYWDGIELDITARKRAEGKLAAVARERQLLAETIGASLNEIYIFDDGTLKFKFVNQGALGNLGYSLEEMYSLTPLDLKPDFNRTDFAALLAPLRSGKQKVATFITRHRRKDGTLYPVEVHLQHVPGNAVFLAVINDITERQKAEAALREQGALLRLAGKAASFGGWRMKKGGDRAIWTEETAALHETPPGFSPSVQEAIDFYTPESRPAISAAVRDCLAEGRPFDVELQIVTAKGRVRWVRAIGQAERDAAGEITSISGSFQDIDERKKLDLKLAEALAEAERFREAMDRVPVYVFMKDLEGRYIYANALTLKLLGCRASELGSKRDEDHFPAESVALIKAADGRVFGGEQSTAEIPVKMPDGPETIYLDSKTPIYSDPERKKITGLLGISTDITELRRAEKALRDSEAFNRMVLDNLPIGIAVNSVLPEVNFSYMNDKFPEFYRTTRERLASAGGFWEAVYEDPEARREIRERILADIASGDPARMHWEDVPLKRGGRTWYVSAKNTPLPDGKLMINTVWDVTDRNKALQALREEEERFRTLSESAPDAIFVHGGGKFMYLNPAACRLFGAEKPGDLIGRDFMEHIAPEYRGKIRERIRRQQETGKAAPLMEQRYLRLGGGQVDVESTAVPVMYKGEAAHLVFVRDVTERKLMSAEKDRLAAAIGQAGEAVVITDSAGLILYVNPAFERVSGYSRAEVLGRNPSVLKSGRQPPGFYKEMWEKLRAGQQWSGRMVNRRKDGALFTEETVISPVKDADGRVANYVAVKRDVTEQLALEERLRQSQKMESLGLLAGGVAHDFNNLLTGITGYAGMIKKGLPADDPKRADLQEILYAAERASELTKQLLIFSRREVANPVAMDINESVRSALKFVGRIIGEDIKLETRLAPAACVTRMDPGHFTQVLMNLAVNARDAMSRGGTLTISTSAGLVLPGKEGAGPMLLLEVADTGCGMTPEVQTRIFEPFFTTKERGRGTGLGLPTVYSIVEQAGGLVQVYSEPGGGTKFSIYLPQAKLTPAELAAPSAEAGPGGGRGETLLLVEDEERLRVLGQRMLEAGGYRVVSAAGGREALEKAAAFGRPFDAVVSDLVLPGMNGRELAAELSRRGLASRFLYVSGYTDELISRHGVLEEGVAFLSKPFTPYSLTAKVREVLDGPPEKARP